MVFTNLVSTDELAKQLANPDWAVIDCRFSLDDSSRGRRDYLEAHIPGAVYAHLDDDLSDPVIPGKTGRHPLPRRAALARTLGSWGVGADVQVVAYDDSGGAMAARLWWLLRWSGHETVALLDGGWPHWMGQGLPVRSGWESRPQREFVADYRPEMLADVEEVKAMGEDPRSRLLDARGADRFRGENETIDPVAGHIPGAISAPYAENLGENGLFKGAAELRARYEELLAGTPAEQAVYYCGSGVSAAHNLVAMDYAGLGLARLYVGSWSEWITDEKRPIAAGEE